MEDKSKTKYISLKEAAKISGYSADHIGYLIREGKIPGKQIYYNIAWMTTEEAILQYKQRKEKGEGNSGGLPEKIQKIKGRLLGELAVLKLFFKVSRYLLPIIIILILSFSSLIFYVFNQITYSSRQAEKQFQETKEGEQSLTY